MADITIDTIKNAINEFQEENKHTFIMLPHWIVRGIAEKILKLLNK